MQKRNRSVISSVSILTVFAVALWLSVQSWPDCIIYIDGSYEGFQTMDKIRSSLMVFAVVVPGVASLIAFPVSALVTSSHGYWTRFRRIWYATAFALLTLVVIAGLFGEL